MSVANHYESFQDFLDDVQYNELGVKKYEWIFGETYLSTGGEETTREIVSRLGLKPGMRVLDVGSGCGGHAFFMAEQFGVSVDGVDLSRNMNSVANMHLKNRPHLADRVKFFLLDITTAELPEHGYDLVYSRDALLHISDKEKLFERFQKWLKPGGRVAFTDYGRGLSEPSEEFKAYVAKRGYQLLTVPEYADLLKRTGFRSVAVENKMDKFVGTLERELKFLQSHKEDFLKRFSEADFDELEQGWIAKLKRSADGDQTWIFAEGTKP